MLIVKTRMFFQNRQGEVVTAPVTYPCTQNHQGPGLKGSSFTDREVVTTHTWYIWVFPKIGVHPNHEF